MNKLQIIQEIFGDLFCPVLKTGMIQGKEYEWCYAKSRHDHCHTVFDFTTQKWTEELKKYNASFSIDFTQKYVFIHFNN